jgi:ABC-type antimicrobial peptide transport system permease subunit
MHFHMLPIVWVIRSATAPAAIAPRIDQALQLASGGVPLTRVWSMDYVLSRSTARSDFNTLLMTTFAITAVLLSAVGIFGMVAYSVEQRRREIAIRVALGASGADIRRLIVWGSMRLVFGGMFIGLVAAFASTRLIAGFLFGVGAHDPTTFSVAPLLIAFVAFLAIWAPTRRALTVDPAVTLRGD